MTHNVEGDEGLVDFGSWVVATNVYSRTAKFYASHKCSVFGGRLFEFAWFWTDVSSPTPRCFHCEEPVPDEVQALVILLMY